MLLALRSSKCRELRFPGMPERIWPHLPSLVGCVLALVLVTAFPAPGAEIQTDDFSIALPPEWVQPQPVQTVNGARLAFFRNPKDNTAVTITVVPNAAPAGEVARQVVAHMRAGGINAGDPVERDGVYRSSYTRDGNRGISYFCSNGSAFSVTTILGPGLDSGKRLLGRLRPAVPGLFPATY